MRFDMPLEARIAEDLKNAMKQKDELRVSCLRMLKTALKRKRVELIRDLTDDEVQGVITSAVRQGQEAAEEFKAGGRTDLAEKEEAEIRILYEYLPRQLNPGELDAILREVISETGAKSAKDLGKVMKAAMSRLAGKAQGKEVNERARRLLS